MMEILGPTILILIIFFSLAITLTAHHVHTHKPSAPTHHGYVETTTYGKHLSAADRNKEQLKDWEKRFEEEINPAPPKEHLPATTNNYAYAGIAHLRGIAEDRYYADHYTSYMDKYNNRYTERRRTQHLQDSILRYCVGIAATDGPEAARDYLRQAYQLGHIVDDTTTIAARLSQLTDAQGQDREPVSRFL